MTIKHPVLLSTAALASAALFSGNAPVSADEVDLSDSNAIADYANSENPLNNAPVSAGEIDLSDPNAIAEYANIETPLDKVLNNTNAQNNSLGQVTNVNQLRDVSPTDWAYASPP